MRVTVKVIPRAKKQKVESHPQGLKVYLTEPALEGKANKRLVDVLAGYFNVKKYNIKIVKGNKQREKVIEVSEGSGSFSHIRPLIIKGNI